MVLLKFYERTSITKTNYNTFLENSDLTDLIMCMKLLTYIHNSLWMSLSDNYFSKNKGLIKLTDSEWRFYQEQSSSLQRMRFLGEIPQQFTTQAEKWTRIVCIYPEGLKGRWENSRFKHHERIGTMSSNAIIFFLHLVSASLSRFSSFRIFPETSFTPSQSCDEINNQ